MVSEIEMTPPLDEFLAAYDQDDNEWWRTSSGHLQNLFDEAVARMRAAEALGRGLDALPTDVLVAEVRRRGGRIIMSPPVTSPREPLRFTAGDILAAVSGRQPCCGATSRHCDLAYSEVVETPTGCERCGHPKSCHVDRKDDV